MKRTTSFPVLMVIVLALGVACAPAATPAPTEPPAPTELPPAETQPRPEVPPEVDATECSVPKQVLVTGASNEVEDIAEGLRLLLLKEFSLRYFGEFLPGVPEPPNILPPFQPDQYGNLVTRLYQIADEKTVPEVVAEIRDRGVQVFADPNYLTGDPEIMTGGLGWHSGGSPSASSTPAVANRADFPNQWAFQQIDVEPRPNNGEGVLVGVFDTDPAKPFQATFAALNPPAKANKISDHGPFVVGLVNGVAPSSTVQLYQVLNEYGQGTLDVLIEQLDLFINSALKDRETRNGAVINLSLGLHQCPDESQDDGIQSLEERLTGAYRNNIVIVAASGNEFRKAMQIPAVWPIVIGVGASNIDDEQACFSNVGNVLAPGGDGESEANCKPATDQCPALGPDCPYGLISEAPSTGTDYAYWSGTSFAAPLVSGLAALILAQEGEEFKQVFDTKGHWMTATVYRAITCDGDENNRAWADVHERVINVQETFGKCYIEIEEHDP